MKFVVIYSSVGVLILVAFLILHFLEKRKENTLLAAVFDSFRAKRTLSEKIRDDVLLPLLSGLLIIVGWPLLLVYVAYQLFFKREPRRKESAQEFAVLNEHLVEKLTVEEIEQRERVQDPLSAVPDLPFGHLNSAWTDFLEKLQPGCELWSFEATWKTPRPATQRIVGYISVNDGQLGHEFITGRKELPYLAKS